MNLVTWQDSKGGHHVGPISKDLNGDNVWARDRKGRICVQVFEFPGKPAEWPRFEDLKPYLTRDERGETE